MNNNNYENAQNNNNYFNYENYQRSLNAVERCSCQNYGKASDEIQYFGDYPYSQSRLNLQNNWYVPKEIIRTVYVEKGFDTRKLSKNYGVYEMKERNGRTVKVGKMNLKCKKIINQKDDLTFDAFFCLCECEGREEAESVVIPYNDFVKRNIMKYLPFFQRNEDCPEKYIVDAFYQELTTGDDILFLQLPSSSGWQDCINLKTTFANSSIVITQLKKYYPADVITRRYVPTDKSFAAAAASLAEVIPFCWKYKLLIMLYIIGVLQFFYEKNGLIIEHTFVVEPKNERNAKDIAKLLCVTNKNTVCPLTANVSTLKAELNSVSDGVVLFRDISFIEDHKKLGNGLNTLLQYQNKCSDIGINNRVISVIISDNPGKIPSEFPAYFISLTDCEHIADISGLRQAVGEFETALIKLLSGNDISNNLVTNVLKKAEAHFVKGKRNEDGFMTMKIIIATAELFKDYGIISDEDIENIIDWIIREGKDGFDTNQKVVNEFRKLLSDAITKGVIEVANQIGAPYFDDSKRMIFIDDKCINMTARTLDFMVLNYMKTTKKRNKVLLSLKGCGKLYSNNNYKRNLDVEVAPGKKMTVSVYSFNKDFLTAECQEKINMLAYDKYSFIEEEVPSQFIPMVEFEGCHKIAGYVINDFAAEPESMYVSGKTRSGKTRFLIEQSILHARKGDKVIIFDQTGAFSHDELVKHLSREKAEQLFSHWDVGKNGIPIDILSLDNCSTLPDKKKRLFSIFSVAAGITGCVQGKHLKGQFKELIEAIEKGVITSLSDVPALFDENDPILTEIIGRLEEVFEGIDSCKQNWEDFLEKNNKIVIISTSSDGIHKSGSLIDIMLASLYEYKMYNPQSRYTVVLDEVEDLCIEKDGPIDTILRKGTKNRLSMMLASQEYSIERDSLGKLIGNCAIQVFFRPKDANIKDIANNIGVDTLKLANLEQGQCVISGLIYDKEACKNKYTVIEGKTYITLD